MIWSNDTTIEYNAKSHVEKQAISSGAAAGIGVGCALVGALAACLFFWLIMKRSKQYRPHKGSDWQGDRNRPHASRVEKPYSKSVGADMRELGKVSSFAVVENSLPQPVEDNAIAGEMSMLRDKIKSHIQSYYHKARIDDSRLDQTMLSRLMDGTPIPASKLASLLVNPGTRAVALRFCVSWTITSRFGLGSNNRSTFLPPEIEGCLRSTSVMADDQDCKSTLPVANHVCGYLLTD